VLVDLGVFGLNRLHLFVQPARLFLVGCDLSAHSRLLCAFGALLQLALHQVQLYLERVELLQELHVLGHDAFVRLLKGLVALGELARHVVQRVLEILALLRELPVQVVVAALAALEGRVLVVHPLLVKLDYSFAQLLEVLVRLFQSMDVVLELLLLGILSLQSGEEVFLLLNKPSHLELQVLDNELHVRLDPREVLNLLFHLGGLLLQLRRHLVIGLHVFLELLDLVI
jgi:hypothetical protein